VESQDLKNLGLKATVPRMRILEILENSNTRHVSAEDVYRLLLKADEDVGLATVYRVLTQFETAGLVTRHHFETGHSVFELNEGEHHDHILCLQCGHIEEFCDKIIEKRQRAIAAEKGFALAEHALILYGDCSRKNCPYRKG